MNLIFFIFLYFSLHVTFSSNMTSVYSMEHIPGIKKNNHIMSSRKLNLPLIIQGVHMFDDPLFFSSPNILGANKQI